MICNKHKNYKGIKKPKYDCAMCNRIFQITQELANSRKPYKSITSDMDCGIIHLLTELLCLMRWRKLPPFFWRQATPAPKEAKKFYTDTYRALVSRVKANNQFIRPLEMILYSHYIVGNKTKIANKFRREQRQENVEKQATTKEISKNTNFVSKKRSNKWQKMRELNNGEEKNQE